MTDYEFTLKFSLPGSGADPDQYIEALAAPDTIDTMPEKTLRAFADHGRIGAPMETDGGDAEEVLARFTAAGIDLDALAAGLQTEGAAAFVKSWQELLARIADKSAALGVAARATGGSPR